MSRSLATMLLLLLIAGSAAGSTLDNYRTRLDAAEKDLAELSGNLGAGDATYERQMLDKIRRNVPATEKVEWQGGSVETQNAWLSASLDAYKNETGAAKRVEILNAARERVEATSAAVAELQRAAAAEQSKDADKQKLAEILRRPEYQPPVEKEESLFQRWWREFWEWFDRQFPRPQLNPSSVARLGSLRIVLQMVIFAAIAGLIAFLLWRFLPYFSARFRERTKTSSGDRVILGEIVSANESASNIFAEAERLAREGDIRGAIRKGYIAVLCELGDRRLVRLARHKTNRDYLRDAQRTPPIFEGLLGLTNNFERNWYGLRSAVPEDWDAFRAGYDATLREARSKAS